MLAAIFDGFIEASPVSVMLRGMMEKVFRAERIDKIFEQHAQAQYTRELLFSDLVNLLSLVVCGIHPSINAAYKAKANEMNVTRNAIYAKLTGVEPDVSAALLRDSTAELSELVSQMGGGPPALLKNYQVRILDGNALAATERRLKVLRSVAAAPLPGKSLVVLDPAVRLAVDLFPCEDGHAQERRLFDQVLATIKAQQLWIADRNMCTLGFLTGIAEREAAFAIREHQNLPWEAVSDLQPAGQVEAGAVLEQMIEIQHHGERLRLRRVLLRLAKPTRHGDAEIVVLTNLPVTAADAARVVVLYRERWQIEGLFLTVTQGVVQNRVTLSPYSGRLNGCPFLSEIASSRRRYHQKYESSRFRRGQSISRRSPRTSASKYCLAHNPSDHIATTHQVSRKFVYQAGR